MEQVILVIEKYINRLKQISDINKPGINKNIEEAIKQSEIILNILIEQDTITIKELEDKIFELEGIEVIFRCSPERIVFPYEFQMKIIQPDNDYLELRKRISQSINNVEYVIIPLRTTKIAIYKN